MDISGYGYSDAQPSHTAAYLLPEVRRALEKGVHEGRAKKVFELGCGNGAVANVLSRHGFEMKAVDPSPQGVSQAKTNFPELNVSLSSSEADLVSEFGRFPFVLS